MDNYESFLKKKIEVARVSMRNCEERPNKDVELEFAAKRNKLIMKLQYREPASLDKEIKK